MSFTAGAPSTPLRAVPLPRSAGEDLTASSPAKAGEGDHAQHGGGGPRWPTIWQRFAVPSARLWAELAELFHGLPADTPIVVHSDLLRLGLPDGDAAPAHWLELLREAAAGRPLLIPSFNYDFCRTGVFAPATDPCQVGALGAEAVRSWPSLRQRTPVFNFCIFENDGFELGPESAPFGPDGTFARLCERNALVTFLGVGMIANTLIHHIEERLDIGYRYEKRFAGSIIDGGVALPAELRFRVRPRIPHAVEYGDLGQAELAAAGCLIERKLGLAQALAFRAADYLAIIGAALARDELHVLTPRSRSVTQDLYRQFGRPLTLAALEG